MNRSMTIMLLAVAGVAALILVGREFSDRMMQQFMDDMAAGVTTISSTEAEEMEWERFIPAVGGARAIQGTHLSLEAAGKVSEITFSSGDMAEENDVLLRLASGVDRAELRSLEASAELAQIEYERARRLREQGSISQSELDAARTEASQADAQAEAQRERVEQKTLRAPFDGRLGIRQADRGQFLQPGEPVVELQQLAPIYGEFSLPEQRLAELEKGYPVQARVDVWRDRTFEGEITAIEPGIREGSRNVRIQATFENEGELLRPGMFMRFRILLPGDAEVLAIPQTAVSFNPYGNSVWLIREEETEEGEIRKTVERRLIQTGERRGDYVAVTDGLEAGDRIAGSGLTKLTSGMVVEIDNEGAPEPQLDPDPGTN